MSKLNDGLKQLRKRAYGIAHSETSETSLTETGGWKIIHGELRLIPLGVKKQGVRHCKSCGNFRKSYGGYCKLQPDIFVNSEAEACEGYCNRTWGNG